MRLAAVALLIGILSAASPAFADDCWDSLLPSANAAPDPLTERSEEPLE